MQIEVEVEESMFKLHLASLSQVVSCREQDLVEPSSTPAGQSIEAMLKKSIMAWRTYAHQDVVLAAVPLALLYFTVMSFVSFLLDSTLLRAHLHSWQSSAPHASGEVQ